MNNFFQAEIINLARYRQQIRKLFAKLKARRALFTIQQAGVNYFSFGIQEQKLAKLLREAVKNETYHLQPARQRVITVNHKKRVVYDFMPLDKIVISVVLSILVELAESYLSNQVFSYRKGRRPLTAVRKFAGYLQQLTKLAEQEKPDCYVIKTDIADYTDSIRLDAYSKLWHLLNHMLEQAHCHLTPYQQQLIESCFRPVYINTEGYLQTNILGVPTGSVASTLAYNLYIAQIDHQMTQIKGLYYSRYSDDILLAHASPEVISQAVESFNCMLNELGLRRKAAKDKMLFLNQAGRLSSYQPWRGANKLTYLGYDIYAGGLFILSTRRQNKLLQALRQRIANVLMLCEGKLSADELGKTLCQAVNQALVDDTFGEHAVKDLLECTHLGMLKHLDYLIALCVAEAVSKQSGAKAFRTVSYRKIRLEWQLQSFVTRRISCWHRVS